MPSRRRSRWSWMWRDPRSELVEPVSNDSNEPPLLDLYKIALDEYRFQVNLNWSRSQYYIILNLGILGLATGLLRLEDQERAFYLGSGLYLAGVACCFLALTAGKVQRGYYRQAKKHKGHLEKLLELEELAIRTTPGMGGTTQRLGRVTTFHNAMLTIILVLDLGGIAFSAWSLVDRNDDSTNQEQPEPERPATSFPASPTPLPSVPPETHPLRSGR
jgi:hypothetical protein